MLARVLAHVAEFLVDVRRDAPRADPLRMESEDLDFNQDGVLVTGLLKITCESGIQIIVSW